MNVSEYLCKTYEFPPCWLLVVDVYVNELGLKVKNYHAKSDSGLSIARKFRHEIAKGEHGFIKLEDPEDFAVVLLNKPGSHCGIYYNGKVLHASIGGVVYQDLLTLKDHYKTVEFWKRG